MTTALVVLAWVVGLGVALAASEVLVHALSALGAHLRISLGLLGILVAFGADAPEVTSALIATTGGATDVGLGVILGSNIYNLAGLLGLNAVLAGRIVTDRYRLVLDGGMNVLLTLGLIALVFASGAHRVVGTVLLLLLIAYVLLETASPDRVWLRLPGLLRGMTGEPVAESPPPAPPEPSGRLPRLVALSAVSVVFIVGGSDLLVNTSITLGARIGLPSAVIGTLVLAVATSLPNTWAAISLARRGLGTAAVAATFSSNSINAALGAGLPALVVPLHVSSEARSIGAPWLLGMTALAIILLATRWSLSRREGMLLIAGYAAFVGVYLLALG